MTILGKPLFTSDLVAYVKAWLEDNAPSFGLRNFSVTEGPDSEKRTGVEVVISAAPGGGLLQEWGLESLSWQFRVYGPQSYDDRQNLAAHRAEELAWILDRMMITLQLHGESIAGQKIINSQRFGGPPAAMPKDAAGRHSYVSTYVLEVASGL